VDTGAAAATAEPTPDVAADAAPEPPPPTGRPHLTRVK